MDNADTITYKLKKKKKKKENDSNNSKESLEKEISSIKKSKTISHKKIGEGEEIKFFFNESPKKSKFNSPPLQTKRTHDLEINKKDEFNFKDFLLNYVNSPERQTKKKNDNEQIERRSSVIYGNPETNLTLNGDEDEDSKISEEKEDNNGNSSSLNSDSESHSKTSSKSQEIFSNKESSKEQKDKNKINNSKESSFKLNGSKYQDSINSNLSNKIEKKSLKSKENYNIINENEEKKEEEKSNDKINKKKIVKMKSSGSIKLLKSNKDSCINSYKNSQKIKSSNTNTFTTATNTYNSFQSLKINNKKISYNYLNWNDLTLTTKLKIKKRVSSTKKIESFREKIKNNFIKNESTSILIYKLKHLNISLDIEKSYIHSFKSITNIQNQKNHYNSISNEYINNSNNLNQSNIESNIKNNIYYPDVYYINKDNNLHNKIHISNFFDKLKKPKNNF